MSDMELPKGCTLFSINIVHYNMCQKKRLGMFRSENIKAECPKCLTFIQKFKS